MISLWAWLGVALAAPLEGRVGERGTLSPVRDAQVRWEDQVVVVDARGRFSLDVPDDRDAVVLSIFGPHHLPQTFEVSLPAHDPVLVYLDRAPDPSEIVVEAFRPVSDMTRHRVDAEQAWETPGTYDDAVRVVQALPGVAVQREYSPTSGELSVRGSRPGDNRFLLDGIDVPYLYHFNQYASVFPASWLHTLDLYSSGFGPQFGDASGAIIDARTDPSQPDAPTGSVNLNLVTVGADVKVPVAKDWWVGVSGRRSHHDIVARGTERYPIWPAFYDAAIRAEQGDGARGHGVFALAVGDRWDRAAGDLDPIGVDTTPFLRHQRDWQMVGYRNRWPGGRAVAAVLHDHQQSHLDTGGRQDVRSLQFPVRIDARDQVRPAIGWAAGASLRSEVTWADIASDRRFGPLVVQEAPAIAWGLDEQRRQLRSRLGSYGELHLRAGPVRVMPGVRVGLDTVGLTPTLEPRLASRFRVAEQTELRLGGGRYQQRPSTLRLIADPDLPTTSGWSGVVGIDQTIANRVEIVAEGHVHTMTSPIVDVVDGPPQVWDRGLNGGVELTLRYRIREIFFAWVYATWGRSWLYAEGSRTPSPADQPLSGGLVTSWHVTPAWQLAVRYRISSGLPYTPIDGSLYDATDDTWLPLPGQAFSARMPLFQKIDLRIAHTARFRRWSLQTSLDVWIVPGQARALYPLWSHDFSREQLVFGPPVLPLLGLRATF